MIHKLLVGSTTTTNCYLVATGYIAITVVHFLGPKSKYIACSHQILSTHACLVLLSCMQANGYVKTCV